MQASGLRKCISYGLILIFTVLLARGLPSFASSLSVGALIRKIIFPIGTLMVLLFVLHNSRPGWTSVFPRSRLRIRKSTLSCILTSLLLSLLVGFLITSFIEHLNPINVVVFVMVLACFFGSLYFVTAIKEHYALALLLLSLPMMDFFEWDSGLSGIRLELGGVPFALHFSYIYIILLFGFWVVTRITLGEFRLTKMRLYLPVILLLVYSLLSFLFITYSHNKDWGLKTLMSTLIIPIPIFIMLTETIDDRKKFYLIIYSAIMMAVFYIFIAFYMSYRTGVFALEFFDIAAHYGQIEYGTGSVIVKGMMLALITPLLLGLLVSSKSIRQVLPVIAALVFTAIMQIMCFSRAGMLATVTGAACLLKKRRAWLLLALFLIILITFWQPINKYALFRYKEIHSIEDMYLERLSHSRYQSWIAAIGMFGEKPIFGVGLKNFGDHAQRFANAYYITKTRSGVVTYAYMHDSHNMFLTVAADLGLVGLGFILWFLGMLLYELVQGLAVVKKRSTESIGWGLLGVYVAHLVSGIFAYGFWIVKSSIGINILCWTLFALMVQLQTVGSKINAEKVNEA